jgi:hypothetical protein
LIPRLLHRIWLGSAPIPPKAEDHWASFGRLHPGFELRTWTDADDYSWLRNRELFERASTWTSRSDVLRFELLARFGGVYVDVDVEPVRSFEPLLTHGAFAGWEDPHAICGAVMGAERGHPAIEALIVGLGSWTQGRPTAPPNVWAGPTYLTAQWAGREDVALLEPAAFYPVHWSRPRSRSRPQPETFAIHHWERSWGRVKEPKLSVLMAWTDRGDGWRRDVKDWVERYWRTHLPEAEFVLGSDGGRELFNRSACFNDAAARSSGDVLFTLDADCVLDPAVIRQAATAVTDHRVWAVPWYTNYRLTEERTSQIIAEDPERFDPPDPPGIRWFDGREAGIGMRFAGFCEVIPRAAWELVGGMDERFEGWGSEDIGMMLALDTLWGPHIVPRSGALHLWHERPMNSGTMNPTRELAYWEAAGDPAAMRDLSGARGSERSSDHVRAPAGWLVSKPPRPDLRRMRFLKTVNVQTPPPPARASKLSILVAFRDADGTRTALWNLIRAKLERELPEAEIIVASDDGEDPFHKTLAINRAAREASGDVFAIWDADSWVDPQRVREAVEVVSELPRWCRPWSSKLKLNAEDTARILELGDTWDGQFDRTKGGRPEGRTPFPFAPPLILTRQAWETVGGMDERFRGWGHEDSAFAFTLNRLVGQQRSLPGTCIHLCHDRIRRTGDDLWPGQTQEQRQANRTLELSYRRARTPEQMRELIASRPINEERMSHA